MICENCQKKIKKTWAYCPFCGFDLEREDSFFNNDVSFNDLVKEVDQQLKGFDKMFKFGVPSRGISISINNVGSKPDIKVRRFGDLKEKDIREVRDRTIRDRTDKPRIFNFIKKKPKKIEEPKSKVRRLSDKVVYEIEVPGVSSVKNVDISKLKNSIEIKAFGKDKAYFKLIPVDMNVSNYYLRDGKLFVELKEEVNNYV